jgi:hypothetical protein
VRRWVNRTKSSSGVSTSLTVLARPVVSLPSNLWRTTASLAQRRTMCRSRVCSLVLDRRARTPIF